MDPARDPRPRAGAAVTAHRRAARRRPRPRRAASGRWPRPPRTLRPTRAGWCFFALTFAVGFAALNTGNNLLYLVLSLMLAFLVLSGLLSESALRGIRVERMLPRELFAGRDNRVGLRITNEQARVTAFAIVVEDQRMTPEAEPRAGRRRRGRAVLPAGRCFALRIGPRESELCHYRLRPERRGELELAGQRISTRFPFGLFVKSLQLPGHSSALVYPEVRALQAPARSGSQPERGDARVGRRGHGAEVFGLREFQSGDPARHIHWKNSLRRGSLVVGEACEEHAAEIEVLLRTRSSDASGAAGERFEERVRSAASELVAHLDAGLRVALRTDGDFLPAAAGPRQRTRLLSFLARVVPELAGAGEPQGADEERAS